MAYQGLSRHINLEATPSPGDRFTLMELIGEGTYGEVFSARDNDTNRMVAIKIMENLAENIEEIQEEFLVFRDLSLHPNIPAFYGVYLKRGSSPESDQVWFVMELCSGGSITDLVQSLKERGLHLTEDHLAYVLRETVEALVYLHANHCMHRDIKGHNILLTESGRVKLVDFGVASHLSATLGKRNTSVGTPYWMAPEVIACEQQMEAWYDARCDVWSLGITAIELAEGDPPLCELHPMRALFQIPRNPPPTLSRPEDWSAEFNDFLSECLVKDLEQRPFAKELLSHPFLKRGQLVAERVRYKLQEEIRNQRNEKRKLSHPEMTMRHGKLKPDRKTRPQKMYVDDLASLDQLTEDLIVEQLKSRYEENQIYTYIGDILIAVNPFTCLKLYTEFEQVSYKGGSRLNNPPHIFAVAGAAYRNLLHERTSQAIVISGESGAGKTESANLLLKQLVFLAKAPNKSLEERILQVNQIMEAFGNARTGINANSSRFGKFLDLNLTRSGKITGANVSLYLLEQSRVVQQPEGERNFHVFYYLYDGLESEKRMHEFFLSTELRRCHSYLTEDSADPYHKKSNIEKFLQLKSAFALIGFTKEEINNVYRILAGILHLGDVVFVETASDDNTDNKSRVLDMLPLRKVSKLLGLDPDKLLEALTMSSVVTKGETITRNNSMLESGVARDATAKGLYGRLFDWLVNQINCLLCPQTDAEPLSIGLLDIFGFENFPRNSFEQLCINIANEQIQFYFNQYVFMWEQQEYMAEGIPVNLVEFSNNRPVLDMLLSRPMGLLSLLDEESRFPRSNDSSLIDKFHANIKSKYYIRPKSNALCFGVQHYAGKVVYRADGFLEKNRNFLPPGIVQILRSSGLDTVRFLFQCPITKTGNLYSLAQDSTVFQTPPGSLEKCDSQGLSSQSRTQQTMATYFRHSLKDLLQKVVSGTPQFVRCIKPNDSRSSHYFDTAKVIRQLRYTGILETIRIRQNGFSQRIPFAEFLSRYSFLAFGWNERVAPTRDNCRLFLLRLKMDGWALGKTKVFLKYYHTEYLSKLYETQIRKIILVQACVRRWLAKARYRRMKYERAMSAITLQRYVRGWLTRRKVDIRRQLEQQRIAAEKQLKPRGKNKKDKDKKEKDEKEKKRGWLKGKLMKKSEKESANSPKQISSEQKLSDKENEEPNGLRKRQMVPNLNLGQLSLEEAAVVIQSHFRGYTVRRKYGSALEKKVKEVLVLCRDPKSAQYALEKEGLSCEDTAVIIQRCYSNLKKENPPAPKTRASKAGKKQKAPPPPGRQIILVNNKTDGTNFAQNVHLMNQEMQKQLRCNKNGIRLTDLHPTTDFVPCLRHQEVSKQRSSLGSHIPRCVAPKRIELNRRPEDSVEGEKLIQSYVKPRTAQNITIFGRGLERPPQRVLPNGLHRSELDLSQLLRRESDSVREELDTSGPYNFRMLLRPTKHLPTESLRKRKGFLPSEPQTMFIQPGDNPNKRRAQKC
ncbi:hypothetical protein RUM43_004242 [Polyplax serrata]|uniref:non-specific serine/threonine protein kinase n=1 Tax=Polyplax serrata TaxID=468196 RepID=A0AAN8SBV7_POLSC